MSSTAIDLDDTSGCSVAEVCAGCGLAAEDRGVATAETPLGVICLTLCGPCADAGIVPVLSAAGAARAALEHCGHLGCDLDEMAAAMGGEPR